MHYCYFDGGLFAYGLGHCHCYLSWLRALYLVLLISQNWIISHFGGVCEDSLLFYTYRRGSHMNS